MTNVPEIRFKGFTDAWEQRKLGEMLSEKISNGIMNRPGRNPLNVKHINVVNLYTPSQIQPSELAYFDATEKDLQKCNVEIGDIFLTRSSLKLEGIAQANILFDDGDYIFDDHIMRIKLTPKYEPFFIKEALNHSSIKKEFMTKAKTGTMTTIGQDDITSSEIVFPLKEEQTRIGSFFRTLDTTITLYKRKLDGLKQLKSAYLQQMFPQAGENVPKVRFEGFTGKWVEVALGDIVERVTRKNANLESTLPLTISAQYGLVDQTEFFNKQVASRDVSGYFLVKNGEFAYNKSYSNGYPWGAVKRLEKYDMGVLSTLYIVFKPITVDSEFLVQYYETDNWHTEIIKCAAEGARNHGLLNITPYDFFKTVLAIPASKRNKM